MTAGVRDYGAEKYIRALDSVSNGRRGENFHNEELHHL